MTAYDVRAKAQAARMLAPIAQGGKGQTVVLTSPGTGGSYNPATGAWEGATATTQTGSGVEEFYKARDIDGSLVLAGDRKFLLSPLNSASAALTPPEVNDTITLADGTTWTIKNVDTLAPAGTVVMFTLQLRRA